MADKEGETALMEAIRRGENEIALALINGGADVNMADKEGETALMEVIRRGENEIALALINGGADANMADKEGKTALMKAVLWGRNEITLALINSGADVNMADKEGKTALIKAVLWGRNEITLALINSGGDVNTADKEGETALMEAARGGRKEIALALINGGADVNTADKEGETAVMKAARWGRKEIALALINGGAEVNMADKEDKTALMKAARQGQNEIALALIKGGADVNMADKKSETALMKAATFERNEIVLALINGGADVNMVDKEGETPLMKAARWGRNVIVLALINGGADIDMADKEGETPLMKAVLWGRNEITLPLINGGADVNMADKEGETTLMKAVLWGRNEITLALINGGADVNMADKEGETALMKAVLWGRNEITLALINGGADVNMADKQGKTALMKAARWGRNEITLALIKGGADVNMADKQGKTALIKAVRWGPNEITLALINSGADVNTADKEGETALMKAVRWGANEIALALINGGADVNTADKEGETALMKAARGGRSEIALALINGGADVNMSDKEGQNALMIAAYNGFHDVTLGLIAAGSHVNMTNFIGNTALKYGIKNEDVVSALISRGNALVNVRDSYGRTPLFYAILENTSVARDLVDNGGNLHQTDNFNVNIVSFFLYNCENTASLHFNGVLEFLQAKGIERQAIVQAIINAMFCKLPLLLYNQSIPTFRRPLQQMLRLAIDYVEEDNNERKMAIQSIVTKIEENEITISNLSNILELLLIKFGVDPNTADEEGNTALHYLALLSLVGIPGEITFDICHKLESFGLAFNRKNCNQETPLFFLLSNALKLAKERGGSSGIHLVEICRFLQKDRFLVNETTQSGQSVFHLVLQLFQEGLNIQDEEKQNIFIHEAAELLKLFAPPIIIKGVTVNKVDDLLLSPLHFWASLSLSSSRRYTSKVSQEYTFEEILEVTFKHLLSCGAMLNTRNRNEETPLHLCKTWSAVKLLVDAGANTSDVDLSKRPPLVVAAQNRLFMNNTDCFYPDVTEDPTTFWKTVFDMGFDLWACDKDGDSVLSNLIESEALLLAKSLVDVACDARYNKSVEALVGVLNAICKDKSTRTTWKNILVEAVLKSRLRPFDVNASLRFCCINIKAQECSRLAEDKTAQDKAKSGLESEMKINPVTSLSVHWQIAKQLLCYGANGEFCLDVADSCPELQDLLTKPLIIDELPMVIPWTSYSKRYENMLAGVARRQNCKLVESYWLHDQPIANGSFGHVFAGINEKDGMEVAIKRIEKLRMVRAEDKREIRSFTALPDCKQILRYLAFFESDDFSYVILELMEGNLDEYFGSTFYDSDNNTVICKDVVMGLKYLHDQNIIHRDLKPSNILYKTHPKLCLKIADFGLSRRLDINPSFTVMSTGIGTRGWIAPEVVKSSTNEHSMTSDIFSCGLLLHYIVSPQRHPFQPTDYANKSDLLINQETERNISRNKMECWDSFLAPEDSDLVQTMLDSDENQRPSASDALDHPMFWSKKQKRDFLSAVGNQPEFECPRAVTGPLNAVESDLESNVHTIFKYGTWNDARYTHMPDIHKEMTQPIVKTTKKGKSTKPNQKTDPGRCCVFLDYFPNLFMEVFKAVTKYGWDTREEIKHAMANERRSGSKADVMKMNTIPILLHNPTGIPILLHTPTGIPILLHTPTGIPILLHTPTGIPILLHNPTGIPILLHNPTGIPILLHNPTGIPILLHTPTGIPILPHNPTGIPILLHNPTGIPILLHNPTGIPILLHTPTGIPILPHNPTGIPILLHNPTGIPILLHNPTGIPILLHNATGIPILLHTPTGIPILLHTPQGSQFDSTPPQGSQFDSGP
ncbi:hypothetical protein QZH41_015776 [Actinostola sp. cb2023]|nr:hypothetical protein QZH41_015776 [Actinostola sp. cb2023]